MTSCGASEEISNYSHTKMWSLFTVLHFITIRLLLAINSSVFDSHCTVSPNSPLGVGTFRRTFIYDSEGCDAILKQVLMQNPVRRFSHALKESNSFALHCRLKWFSFKQDYMGTK